MIHTIKISLHNKKIGIWGFGVVGQSALNYLQNFTDYIQILDLQIHDHPHSIVQTPQTTQTFLEDNDYILASPGIKLHTYEQFKHKFITEADIFAQNFQGKTIAITGTLGKTSITTLLQKFTPNSIAAGNIGHAMLNVLQERNPPKTVVLELSSFQLHYIQQFAPNIAILTNFYPNHLDHHQTEQEYWQAKCNIFKSQTSEQTALIPCNLIQRMLDTIQIQSQIFLFCSASTCISKNHNQYQTFVIQNNNITTTKSNTIIFKNIDQLPNTTYQENWLIIAAALYLNNIQLPTTIKTKSEEHRLEYITTIGATKFYNDSKSTVWQATKQAIDTFNNEPCILFLGGLSKGTNRTPLIQYLSTKHVIVIAFGQEARNIQQLCNTYHIPCSTHQTLEQAFEYCTTIYSQTKNVIFSPAGSSFDLFKNYIERGMLFKNLVRIYSERQK